PPRSRHPGHGAPIALSLPAQRSLHVMLPTWSLRGRVAPQGGQRLVQMRSCTVIEDGQQILGQLMLRCVQLGHARPAVLGEPEQRGTTVLRIRLPDEQPLTLK